MPSFGGERLKGAHSLEFSLSALLGLVTLAALVPFMVLGASTMYVWDRNARTEEINNISHHAAALVQAVDRELRGHIETAEALSESRSLRRGDYQSFWEHAEAVAVRAGGHFILIDRSAQQVVNTRRPIGTPLPKTANPAAISQVLEAREAKVGNLGIGAVAQEMLFAVRVPVEIDGEIRYVLSYVPRASAIFDVMHQTFLPEGWFASVIDGNARIVARSHRHDDFFGKQASSAFIASLQGRVGVVTSIDLEGRESLTAYQTATLSDWKIIVWAPKALLEEPVSRVLYLVMGLSAMALLASLLAAYLAGWLIRAPTVQLLQTADGLGQGKAFGYRPSLMREANILGSALDEAARTIETRETALAEREAHTRFILKELSHRSKNLLAVIQAMANQSARSASSLSDFMSRFRERVAGLARSHDLLVKDDWSSVPIRDLILIQLEPFVDTSGDRIVMQGPLLLLKPVAAQNLGLALHELATNSVKHGSLSVPSGQVQVTWGIDQCESGVERVRVHWREVGGPPCLDPAGNTGFGHTILSKVAPSSLLGEATMNWAPDGFEWVLDVPAEDARG
jgi:two-component sensor histidine kinase